MSIKIEVPNNVIYRGKKYYLTFNNARGWNNFLYNNIKKEFHRIVKERVSKLDVITKRCKPHVRYNRLDNRLYDIDGVCVVAKFLNDSMTKCGKFEDDNRKFISGINYDCGDEKRDIVYFEYIEEENSLTM